MSNDDRMFSMSKELKFKTWASNYKYDDSETTQLIYNSHFTAKC